MFDWDQHNERKIAAHRVTKRDVEDAFTDPRRLGLALGVTNGEERHLLVGATQAGRVVKAVYTWRGTQIRVVTAYSIRRGPEFRAYQTMPW